MFWRRRKKSVPSRNSILRMEKLEDRQFLAAVPLVSGQALSFRDADGTYVTVKLKGPGQGTLELTNGELTDAAMDSLMLSGTTGESKLKISTRGGSVKGTTINQLVIEKALGEVAALGKFKGRKVDLAEGGELLADGDVANIHLRNVQSDATIDVNGDVGRLKTWGLEQDASVQVAGTVRKFVAKTLAEGAEVAIDLVEMLKVKQYANGATFDVGAGGITRAKIKNIYNSAIASEGAVGQVIVKGDMYGTAVASNIDSGSDEIYGTIDDFVIDSAAAGTIGMVTVRGAMGTGDARPRVVASGTIGEVRAGGP